MMDSQIVVSAVRLPIIISRPLVRTLAGIATPKSLSGLFFLSIMGVTDFNLRNTSGFPRIAISAYVLAAMVKKRLAVEASL
jgi:hypothetical protein